MSFYFVRAQVEGVNNVVTETRSEDIMIFNATNPQYTPLRPLLSALQEFFSMSKSEDPTNRFNFIMFEEHGPVYFEDFLFDPAPILDVIEELSSSSAPPNLAGGIMVAITFIIDIFKIVGGKCFRLIVLVDPLTPALKNVEVLQDLMDKVRDFPFFVDFVVIGEGDPRKELILMKFAKKNGGNVFFAENPKKLKKILATLSEKKELEKHDDEKYYLSEENEPFFENLGADLWMVEDYEKEGKRCLICGQSQGELVKCPKCEMFFHGICLAHWAKVSNIGLPHVFRCPNCFYLLRLPKDYVLDVQKRNLTPEFSFQTKDPHQQLRERESSLQPKLTKGTSFFGTISNENEEDGWLNDDFEVLEDDELQIKFCPECGTLNFPEALRCSKCGHPL